IKLLFLHPLFGGYILNFFILVIEPFSKLPIGTNPSRSYNRRAGFDSETLKLTAGKRFLAFDSNWRSNFVPTPRPRWSGRIDSDSSGVASLTKPYPRWLSVQHRSQAVPIVLPFSSAKKPRSPGRFIQPST